MLFAILACGSSDFYTSHPETVDYRIGGLTESATSSNSITDNIASVDTASQKTSDGTDQTRLTGEQLASLSAQLETLVGQFHLSQRG